MKTRLFGTLLPFCASPFLTFQQVVAPTFGTLGTISKKTNEFILCFASIVFIPPPFHISPVSRGRATFYYLCREITKITFVGRLQNTITNNWQCQLTLMTPSGEIEKALRIKEAYYADKQSQNS